MSSSSSSTVLAVSSGCTQNNEDFDFLDVSAMLLQMGMADYRSIAAIGTLSDSCHSTTGPSLKEREALQTYSK